MRALRRHLHFAGEFRDLRIIDTAAKLRVIFKEAERTGGLHISKKVEELDEAHRISVFSLQRAKHLRWTQSAFSRTLLHTLNIKQLEDSTKPR